MTTATTAPRCCPQRRGTRRPQSESAHPSPRVADAALRRAAARSHEAPAPQEVMKRWQLVRLLNVNSSTVCSVYEAIFDSDPDALDGLPGSPNTQAGRDDVGAGQADQDPIMCHRAIVTEPIRPSRPTRPSSSLAPAAPALTAVNSLTTQGPPPHWPAPFGPERSPPRRSSRHICGASPRSTRR